MVIRVPLLPTIFLSLLILAVLRFASDITDTVFGFDYFVNGFVQRTTLVLLRSFGFVLFAITISFCFKEGDPSFESFAD